MSFEFMRGRIAASAACRRIPPSDIREGILQEDWLGGYDAEVAEPIVKKTLRFYPKQLKKKDFYK